MSLVVKNLTKRFTARGTPAVADVSFTAPTGGITTLLGPSGSGKSTVLRVIAGLEQPDAGVIMFGDEDVTNLPAQKRGLGFVFQSYALFKHMTVRKNIAFGLGVRKVDKEESRHKVEELLKLVQLDGLGDRYPTQLSGGQRQRVAFARALAIEPKMLLLDEPFGALDAMVRVELRDWLRKFHDEQHVTTMLVTHDQEEAAEVSDHVVVMHEGHVAQVGTPRDDLRQAGDAVRRRVRRRRQRAARADAQRPRQRRLDGGRGRGRLGTRPTAPRSTPTSGRTT